VWTGTEVIEYAYQWQECTGPTVDTCSDIEDAEESTYFVPKNSAASMRYRFKVTATNPAPTFDQVFRYSPLTGAAADPPNTQPGYDQVHAPGISVNDPGSDTSPTVGDTMYAEFGANPDPPEHDGWFNPPSVQPHEFQWLRCEGSGSECDEIPGATQREYTLVPADGTRTMKVRVSGMTGAYSNQAQSGASYYVISLPATIGDPIPDPDGGPPKSQAPALSGNAWVGETLAGTVGGWKDPTTEFSRRWVRCDPEGNACTYIQEVASTDPETGSTYTIREGDLGYTIRMRVTADVNGDISDGGGETLPQPTEVDTPQSAVVTERPKGQGPGGVIDTDPPVITNFRVANKGKAFKFGLSEMGTGVITIHRTQPGRKVGKKCKKPSKKNRKRKKCTRTKRAGKLTLPDLAAGDVTVPLTKKLKRGSYRATLVATDIAQNKSKPARTKFKIKKKR
jgi:hypothetical protein